MNDAILRALRIFTLKYKSTYSVIHTLNTLLRSLKRWVGLEKRKSISGVI